MKNYSSKISWVLFLGLVFLAKAAWAHVTLHPNQPLRPGGFGQVSIVVPNERLVDTIRVTLEVPEAFLQAGGRLSRVDFPEGWRVKLDKEDKPGDIYANEMDARAKRSAGADRPPQAPKTEADQKEAQAMEEMRRKWIKRVTFEGGTIPPDGFKTFQIDFQLPPQPGEFRFPAVQSYADGEDISWSELVKGASRPAPTLTIDAPHADRTYPLAASIMSGFALLISLFALLKRCNRGTA